MLKAPVANVSFEDKNRNSFPLEMNLGCPYRTCTISSTRVRHCNRRCQNHYDEDPGVRQVRKCH